MPSAFSERRLIERIGIRGPCWLVRSSAQPVLVGQTADITPYGAGISVERAGDLAEGQSLTVFFDPGDPLAIRCVVVWRRDKQIGVEFLEAPIQHPVLCTPPRFPAGEHVLAIASYPAGARSSPAD